LSKVEIKLFYAISIWLLAVDDAAALISLDLAALRFAAFDYHDQPWNF